MKSGEIMEHKHHAKSSLKFMSSEEILDELNLKGNEVFMDAGCGDGHIAIKAVEDYIPDGVVYAIDNYEPSIEEINAYKQENNLENLKVIKADITKDITEIEDGSVDMVFMFNVIHGFKASDNLDEVIESLLRIIRKDGKIAIVEFNPIDWSIGPPTEIKYAPSELVEIFDKYDFKKICLNDNIGQDGPEGKSHYLIIFQRE